SRLRSDPSAAVFGIEAAFGAARVGAGFDLVVGNPPWIRAERIDQRERDMLAARYRWWRASGKGWLHQPDLSVAFLERSHELLANGGTMGFLVPSKLATAGYAATCRAALAHHATLHVVAPLHDDPRAGFEATTYPLALVASRRVPPPQHRVRLSLGDGPGVLQSGWRERESCSLASSAVQQMATRLSGLPRLEMCFPASLGVKTGINQAFIDPPRELDRFTRPAV